MLLVLMLGSGSVTIFTSRNRIDRDLCGECWLAAATIGDEAVLQFERCKSKGFRIWKTNVLKACYSRYYFFSVVTNSTY